MKAAIYKGIKDVTINELAMPVCGENDIIVRNLYASICGSDINAYYHGGDSVRIFKGFEFGHEMISEVVEVGQNVRGLKLDKESILIL